MKKRRKPRDFKMIDFNNYCLFQFIPKTCQSYFWIDGRYGCGLKQAKRLQAWLGKAIKYLEQEKAKNEKE